MLFYIFDENTITHYFTPLFFHKCLIYDTIKEGKEMEGEIFDDN